MNMTKKLLAFLSLACLTLNAFAVGGGTFNMIWYDGANGITIGTPANPHSTGWFVGSEYSAQAYMGPAGTAEGGLVAESGSITAFDLTGATAAGKLAADGAGQLYNPTAIITGRPLGNAAIQIRVWYNGGLYSTYEAALAAGKNVGKSAVMTTNLKLITDPTAQSLTDIGMTTFTVQSSATKTPTTSVVTSSLNPSTHGSSVTFTSTVSPSAASGTVTFKDGTNTLGTGTLSGGVATFATNGLSVGSHSLTAEYA
ncbi:MAG: Ig-like domain-containing protein, partial [Verrucomicrobiota bacterium]